MPIIIENISGDLSGVCTYQLRINRDSKFIFTHNRPDGLARCLKEAYLAARDLERKARGAELKKKRVALGMTLRDVSDITGKSISFLSDMENGRKSVDGVGLEVESKLDAMRRI